MALIIKQEHVPKTLYTVLKGKTSEELALYIQLGIQYAATVKSVELKNKSPDLIQRLNLIQQSKGKMGEEQVYQILNGRFSVRDVSNKGYSGDLIVTASDIDILIEVKNYSRTVPKPEVEKFHRDLKVNPSMKGGILISLHSGIYGARETFTLCNGEMPYILLQSDNKDIICATVDIMLNVIKCKAALKKDFELYERKYAKLHKIIKKISRSMNGLSRAREQVSTARDLVNKQLSLIYEHIQVSELHIQTLLDKIRDNFCGKEDVRIVERNDIKAKICSGVVNNCLFNADEVHRLAILDLLNKWLNLNCVEGAQTIFIGRTKDVEIQIKPLGRSFIVQPFKHHTVIGLSVIQGRSLILPVNCTYKNTGTLYLRLTKSREKNEQYSIAEKFIKTHFN